MRKEFHRIAKDESAVINRYITYRSEYGTQVYSLQVTLSSGKFIEYDDGYFVGDPSGKEKVLREFKKEISA